MSHLTDRADIHSYFASMNPLASKIMDSLALVKHENESAWHQMEPDVKEDLFEAVLVPADVKNRYSRHWTSDDGDVEVFPKFVPSAAKKIIVDDNDGKTWEDEHSGQFSWETSSQLELNLADLDSVPTPAVPRKSQDSAGSATSPNGVKPAPVRKARLVENWLDSPVLKAMQENSSASQSDGSDREQAASSEEPDILKKFGITFSLNSGVTTDETSTDEVFAREKRSSPQRSSSKRHSSRRSESFAKSPNTASPPKIASSPPAEFQTAPSPAPPPPPAKSAPPPPTKSPIAASPRAKTPRNAPLPASSPPGVNLHATAFHSKNSVVADDVAISFDESWRSVTEANTENMSRDEEKEEEKSMTTTTTTTRTTTPPMVECDVVEGDFLTKATTETTESVTAVKTGFDFLDNW